MNQINRMIRHTNAWIDRHSAQILIGTGIGMGIGSTVLAVMATPKAMKKIDQRKKELETDQLTAAETVKACWKEYIPSGAAGLMSIFCLIGSNAVSEKRSAALAAAYSLSETARINYRDKVVEVIGEKKEREVREAVAKEQIERQPIRSSEVIITNRGNTLCYDLLSGRPFRSSVESIKRAENEINKRMLAEMYVSLNDFYELIGLSANELGDMVGWNTDQGLINVWFSSHLTEDNEPCLAISFEEGPIYRYDRLY